jgi:hypothetical protein
MKLKEFRVILYQLTRPMSYLKIKHDDKWIYDWLLPVLLTALCVASTYYLIPLQKVVSQNGLISQLTDFIANLPGFFIAALAAVATFNKHDIDELMANSPKIEILHHGHPQMIEMTRRRFLCVLFSYLTAISILIILVTRFCLSVELPEDSFVIWAWSGIALFFLVLWQMIIATILGLYYLGERLHSPQ